MGLSRACLAVSENSHVEAIKSRLDEIFRVLEHLFLCGKGSETLIVNKLFFALGARIQFNRHVVGVRNDTVVASVYL